MPSHAQSAETLERWRKFPALERLPPDPERPRAVLTFDDGPDPDGTPAVLDALDEVGAKATFFLVGEQLMRHHAIAREIHQRGHELALHCFEHADPDVWPPPVARDDVARGLGTFEVVAGKRPRWYRPPYGILTSGRWAAARRAGLRPVLWSAWGRDWTPDATPGSVRGTVGADLRGGGTVLLHDTDRVAAPDCWKATLDALPALVADCRRAGLRVGPLADHGLGAPASDGFRRRTEGSFRTSLTALPSLHSHGQHPRSAG